jgi:hypothetical protein
MWTVAGVGRGQVAIRAATSSASWPVAEIWPVAVANPVATGQPAVRGVATMIAVAVILAGSWLPLLAVVATRVRRDSRDLRAIERQLAEQRALREHILADLTGDDECEFGRMSARHLRVVK